MHNGRQYVRTGTHTVNLNANTDGSYGEDDGRDIVKAYAEFPHFENLVARPTGGGLSRRFEVRWGKVVSLPTIHRAQQEHMSEQRVLDGTTPKEPVRPVERHLAPLQGGGGLVGVGLSMSVPSERPDAPSQDTGHLLGLGALELVPSNGMLSHGLRDSSARSKVPSVHPATPAPKVSRYFGHGSRSSKAKTSIDEGAEVWVDALVASPGGGRDEARNRSGVSDTWY